MRSVLDYSYRAGFAAAAFFLALIAVVILAQVIGRFFGIVIPSADEVAAFSMAASIFLGLAATLRAGAHVRVELLLTSAPRPVRLALDLGAHVFGAVMLGYLSWHTISMTWDSLVLNERSPGLWAIPLWLPQAGMSLGMVLMSLACAEGAFNISRGRRPTPSGDAAAPVQSE